MLWARCRYMDELIDKHGEVSPGAEESKEKGDGLYNSDVSITLQLDHLFSENLSDDISCLAF